MTTLHTPPPTVTRREGHQVYFPPPLPTTSPPFDSRTTSLPSPYLEETNKHDTTAMQPQMESSLQVAVGHGEFDEEIHFLTTVVKMSSTWKTQCSINYEPRAILAKENGKVLNVTDFCHLT